MAVSTNNFNTQHATKLKYMHVCAKTDTKLAAIACLTLVVGAIKQAQLRAEGGSQSS